MVPWRYRSEMTLGHANLPPHCDGPRSAGMAILFVLMPGQEPAWHTVRSAELWLYHCGSPVTLGADIEAGQHRQVLIPAGHWQRARLVGTEPSLFSCVVVPGSDFADFRLE